MDTVDAGTRVAVLLSEREMTLELAADAAGLEVERLRAVLDGRTDFAMQEIIKLAAALDVDARYIAFGDVDAFAMRADQSAAIVEAQAACRRALDALLGLEALVR